MNDGAHYVTLVGIMDDSSRIPFDGLYHSVSQDGGNDNSMTVLIQIVPGCYSPRLRAIEIYASNVSTHDVLQERLITTLQLTLTGWVDDPSTATDHEYDYSYKITEIDSNQPSLFENIQRSDALDNRSSYYIKEYVNGRNYVVESGRHGCTEEY